MNTPGPGIAFIAVGCAFMAIGVTSNLAFIAIGASFIAVGGGLLARHRRATGDHSAG